MQKGHVLHFKCYSCKNPLHFSIFDLDKNNNQLLCSNCSLCYDFSNETLKRQITKFELLCRQIQDSEEILSNTAVGVYVGDREIKIPFKILLSRLNSTLDLMIDNHPVTINFRIEPTKDTPLKDFSMQEIGLKDNNK